jgi:hypothetical protein
MSLRRCSSPVSPGRAKYSFRVFLLGGSGRQPPKPNSAYLLDSAGTIVYRQHWANIERGLRTALAVHVEGRPLSLDRSRAIAVLCCGRRPPARRRQLRRPAGGRDVWAAALPLAVLARLSSLFRWLPTDRCGMTATALVACVLAVAAAAPLT